MSKTKKLEMNKTKIVVICQKNKEQTKTKKLNQITY